MRVLILYKNESRAYQMAQRFCEDLKTKGIKASISESHEVDVTGNDLIIVLGGDGTIIKIAHYIAGTGIPLLGVNLGKIGFLSSLEPDDWPVALEILIHRQYSLKDCLMIKAEIIRGEQTFDLGTALNDVVIKSKALHPITIELSIDNQIYSVYRGDGVICSTPTGSTAYSYSAGGPLLANNIKTLVVTPICPLFACARALIVDSESQVAITVNSEFGTEIALDGEIKGDLFKGDRVLIGKSDKTVSMIQINIVSPFKKFLQCRNRMS